MDVGRLKSLVEYATPTLADPGCPEVRVVILYSLLAVLSPAVCGDAVIVTMLTHVPDPCWPIAFDRGRATRVGKLKTLLFDSSPLDQGTSVPSERMECELGSWGVGELDFALVRCFSWDASGTGTMK